MTDETFEQIREKDHAVLHCIREGNDDTRQIRKATTLGNRDVNYCLDKLERLGLVETETPDGRVTEVVDGEKRSFKAPRQAQLTDDGARYFVSTDRKEPRYQAMTHDELAERVQELEKDVEELQNAFEAFRKQVLRKLE